MPDRITTYKQAFDLINVRPNERINLIIKKLSGEGRSEKSICFAIWKSHEKIMQFRGDPRFYSVFENEIKKWSWGRDDPRWNDYNKRKEEAAKAAELEAQRQKHRQEEQHQKDVEFLYRSKYPGYVYFIQGETGGPVKIGYSDDVSKRLKGLQTGHPDNLIILFAYPGSQNDEKAIHERLNNHRLRGEWFRPDNELFLVIEEYKVKPLPQVSDFEF
jgi:hypothetical protein